MSSQLTLIHEGEFIVCEDVVFTPPATITATASLPINTMKSTSVRLGNEIVPLPFIRSQERKVVSQKIRIEGPVAAKIAAALELAKPPAAPAPAAN
ncbi:MAG: hypothetical protein ACREKL_09410 [Chthoniobacterales bacterium]